MKAVMTMEADTVSIEESGLGRWARLKKARKDRKKQESWTAGTPEGAEGKAVRGKAAPTAYPDGVPVEVGGAYRPWLPPLTADTPDAVPAIVGGDGATGDEHEQASTDELSTEEAAVAEEMGLPDISTLEEESDFSVFMRDGVPDKLRRLALRKLWASNPLFGFRDGLNDYDEDFRGLSDYVYNSVAMKNFTEPKGEPEDASGDTAEAEGQDADQTGEQAEEQAGGQAGDQDAKTVEADSEPENTDDNDGNTDRAPHDGEALAAEDDPELG